MLGILTHIKTKIKHTLTFLYVPSSSNFFLGGGVMTSNDCYRKLLEEESFRMVFLNTEQSLNIYLVKCQDTCLVLIQKVQR